MRSSPVGPCNTTAAETKRRAVEVVGNPEKEADCRNSGGEGAEGDDRPGTPEDVSTTRVLEVSLNPLLSRSKNKPGTTIWINQYRRRTSSQSEPNVDETRRPLHVDR